MAMLLFRSHQRRKIQDQLLDQIRTAQSGQGLAHRMPEDPWSARDGKPLRRSRFGGAAGRGAGSGIVEKRMASLSVAIAFGVRLLLVLLFLPFSALDKILNFKGAVGQARQAVHATGPATLLILIGLGVEIGMSLCILTGFADRAAAFVLAGYCGVTALLWKPFWAPGDFWAGGKGRELFWDFLKNFALAGGFLLITFGTGAGTVENFFADPLASSQPYAVQAKP
jgi:putative oxidoreductase